MYAKRWSECPTGYAAEQDAMTYRSPAKYLNAVLGTKKIDHAPATTEDRCFITESPIVISNTMDVTWDQDDIILAHVLIESGGKLTITAEIGMPKDAIITIQPNGELYVNGGRLYNTCTGHRWEGIIVVGDDSKHQYKVYGERFQGYLSLTNESVIEGANTAAVNRNRDVPGANGGVIVADKATFRNNLTGVDFADYQNTHFATGAPQRDLSIFTNCTFIADEDFGSDYNQFNLMAVLADVRGIRFGACTFTNDYPTNLLTYVDHKKTGIHAVRAGFEVSAICLSNPLYPCTEYAPSSFKGFAIGISTWDFGLKTFSVTNTHFEENGQGIVAIRSNNFYVVNNTFEVGSSLPFLDHSLDEPIHYAGINVQNCTGYKIEENEFEGYDDIPANTQTVGVSIDNSWDEPNEVYRNTFTCLHYANVASGDNRGNSAEIGLRYECNTNITNGIDFFVPESNAPAFPSSIAQNQGTADKAAGNVFSTVGGAAHPAKHFWNQGQHITYFWQDAPLRKPTHYTTATVTLPLMASDSISCVSRLPNPKGHGRLEPQQIEDMVDIYETSTDTSEQIHAANMLIRHYLMDEDSIQLPAVRTWLANKGTLGAYFAIVDSWLEEGDASGAQQALDSIPYIFSLSGRTQVEYDYFSTLKNLQISALQGDTSDALMVTTHFTTLQAIADSGYYYASIQAQILLNHFEDAGYQHEILLPKEGLEFPIIPCDTTPASLRLLPQPEETLNAPEELAAEAGTNEMYIRAVPNPAHDETLLHYLLPEGVEKGMISVVSAQGQVVWEYAVQAGEGMVRCPLDAIQPGLYLCRLIAEGRVLKTSKLVVVK
ncbi:MAG: T9SS type A sorting domain-containing protein [Saprospiraceae bacterium]|nr:T9SS type A sorting domain-containing protein [Saprospiraceae bacterium]